MTQPDPVQDEIERRLDAIEADHDVVVPLEFATLVERVALDPAVIAAIDAPLAE